MGKLERLGFIPKAGQYGLDISSSIYTYGKSWVPKQLKPTVEMGENVYFKYGQPLVGKAAKFGNNFLLLVDGKVDGTMKTTTIVYNGIEYSRVEELGKRLVSAKDTTKKQLKRATSLVTRIVAALAKAFRNTASTLVKGAVTTIKRGFAILQQLGKAILEDEYTTYKMAQLEQLEREQAQKAAAMKKPGFGKPPLYPKNYPKANSARRRRPGQ